jgi:hypothetical protein
LAPPKKPSAIALIPSKGSTSTTTLLGIAIALLGLVLLVVGACPLLAAFASETADEAISMITSSLICLLPAVVLLGIGILLTVMGVRKGKVSKERLQTEAAQAKADREQEEEVYQQMMERWEKLYYCHRDDCVFIPDEGTSAPLSKMHLYLYEP